MRLPLVAPPLPRWIDAGFRRYRLTQDLRDTTDADKDLADFDYAGRSYHAQAVVWLRPDTGNPATGMPYAEQRETLLHELMHVALGSAGLQHVLKEAARSRDVDPEEAYVSAISAGLLQVLDRNPRVRRYIWPDA